MGRKLSLSEGVRMKCEVSASSMTKSSAKMIRCLVTQLALKNTQVETKLSGDKVEMHY